MAAEQKSPCQEIPIALQLYSVRHDCEKDDGKNFPAVVEAVAKMGYEGVEFAGYYGWQAPDIKKVLDDNGLKCCGAHVAIDTLLGGELQRSIDFHRTLDNRFLIVPGLPEAYRCCPESWAETARMFNTIAEDLQPHGMYTGYHNHHIEFEPMEGQVPWDIFFGAAHERVVMQLDIGNAIHGGGDCAEILRKYPGRSLTIHIKEYGGEPEAAVGEGEVNWAELLPLIAETGGTQWYIIEHERDPARAMTDVERCIRNFREILDGL
jgi:sugar phosphate isomerase/epimerase